MNLLVVSISQFLLLRLLFVFQASLLPTAPLVLAGHQFLYRDVQSYVFVVILLLLYIKDAPSAYINYLLRDLNDRNKLIPDPFPKSIYT